MIMVYYPNIEKELRIDHSDLIEIVKAGGTVKTGVDVYSGANNYLNKD